MCDHTSSAYYHHHDLHDHTDTHDDAEFGCSGCGRADVEHSIYMDANATTHISSRAMTAMSWAYDKFGYNPSSVHVKGALCRSQMEKYRQKMLSLIGADPVHSGIIFTSGATESNNLAISSVMDSEMYDPTRTVCVISAVEHDSVLNTVMLKYDYYLCGVDRRGYLNMAEFEKACTKYRKQIRMISIIAGQNEVGVIQDVGVIVETAKRIVGGDCIVHVDATQLFGKYRISVVDDLGDADFVSGSAHKFHGPKGVGFLYVRTKQLMMSMQPLFHGGMQEGGMRPGTENFPAVVGMTVALEESISDKAIYMEQKERIAEMREHIRRKLIELIGKSRVTFNGDPQYGLYNTLNVTIDCPLDESLAKTLNRHGICVSSASACTMGAPSHVLTAMGLTKDQMKHTIRISLSRENTIQDCDILIRTLLGIVDGSERKHHHHHNE